MSLSLRVTRELLRLRPSSTRSVDSLRKAIRSRGDAAPIPRALHRVARVRETLVNEQRVVHLEPLSGAAGSHLIYTHGGCYTFPLLGAHWGLLASLVARAGVSVTVPLYGLAPEHTVDEAYELLDRVYREAIVAHGGPVFLGGDSAGGGLALGQAQRYRDAGKVAPAGILLISPWVDATMANPDIGPLERRDRMLGRAGLVEAGRLWAGPRDTRDPLVSPLLGDLSGLPPVHVYQGDHDLFLADAKRLARGIHDAGGQVELRITRGGFHDFPAAPWLPEARRAVGRMAEVLQG
ncbi:Putative acetyl-hydrolase LipR [Frondihabitans sp. 762G35]|uniref:alpha/beta hydrolase n=1 Tax=Frondihabitans sp. 762G35 TaxID=1446794 RepID=UPI000D208050|nr:alpha/beta hydrolase [Frondihabitans sp. 762G35]ARC57776.1 Putative acetyl-hydrolase LipR [Frondihabitans sp. 762G35]